MRSGVVSGRMDLAHRRPAVLRLRRLQQPTRRMLPQLSRRRAIPEDKALILEAGGTLVVLPVVAEIALTVNPLPSWSISNGRSSRPSVHSASRLGHSLHASRAIALGAIGGALGLGGDDPCRAPSEHRRRSTRRLRETRSDTRHGVRRRRRDCSRNRVARCCRRGLGRQPAKPLTPDPVTHPPLGTSSLRAASSAEISDVPSAPYRPLRHD